MKLSIIIPVYNEEKTLPKIVEKLEKLDLGDISKEILIVNDASTDSSAEAMKILGKKYRNIIIFNHEKNQGKGAAIRTGFSNFTGDIAVIQDGDLEYNPEDFKRMIKLIIEKKTKVVYGSRLLGRVTGFNIASHYYGNLFLSFITQILYNAKITDMETCYKMMSREVAKNLKLKSNGFNIEPEITAKIIKRGYKIIEIPINYNCRTFEEGKKITWRDGIVAVYCLFKYRFFN